jgi:hypothetical protein
MVERRGLEIDGGGDFSGFNWGSKMDARGWKAVISRAGA